MHVEIACDESGSEGRKLVGGTTDVFAHASLHVELDVAAVWLAEVRVRARSPAEEVKAGVVLRAQNRALLRDLLGPDGPFAPAESRAHVHLTEKRYLLVVRLLTLLDVDAPPADVHREAPAVVGAPAWDDLLSAFNDLMRARVVEEARARAARYRDRATLLARSHAGTALGEVVAGTVDALPATDAGLLGLLGLVDGTRRDTGLDPLLPALAAAVAHWGAGGRGVAVVHDEHRTLREAGLAHLEALCRPAGALREVRFVDSRDDPRVQLADFLAGAARRVASEALAGRVDDELVALLRPYASPVSTWGHAPSWARLAPRAPAPG